MKKIIAISLLLGVSFALGSTWKELIAHAAGGGGTPKGNGDVNGDGVIDIADAIYLLEYLFMAGPKIVAIECPPPAGKGLAATGQTKCYDTDGNEIDCGSAAFPGQDGFYQTGCPMAGRFVDNKEGTVTDSCTGLMWQKDTADVNGDGKIGIEDRLDWQRALQYCETLRFAGHDDWRLPNLRELQSILDYGRSNPAIDPVFGAVSDWYCSSSPSVASLEPYFNWNISFSTGDDYWEFAKDALFFVRAVRGGL